MNRLSSSLFAMVVAVIIAGCSSQGRTAKGPKNAKDTLVIMSYNIENYFHSDDDPDKNDDDFTADGRFNWTEARMTEKAERIKKVIMAANGWNTPAMVGLCEIEGQKAVDYLLEASGLKKIYKSICYPTPDKRGIDIALLYDDTKVELLSTKNICVSLPDSDLYTRDILYVKIKYAKQTFHVMMNHWPSKRGSGEESSWRREHAAQIARTTCDSINNAERGKANIILLGDFNDQANSKALTDVLGATKEGNPYINLSGDVENASYKYNGIWGTIDHIIVSPEMCKTGRPQYKVIDLPFIRETDELYGGYKPLRTYGGRKYLHGYSDHFPVMIKKTITE